MLCWGVKPPLSILPSWLSWDKFVYIPSRWSHFKREYVLAKKKKCKWLFCQLDHFLNAQGMHPRLLCLLHWLAGAFFTTRATWEVSSSVPQSCPTLCDPMDCRTPGLPVRHQLPGVYSSSWPVGVLSHFTDGLAMAHRRSTNSSPQVT